MVCHRCIQSVEQVLNDNGIAFNSVQLGKVGQQVGLTDEKKSILVEELASKGFSLLTDKFKRLIELIKNQVIEVVHFEKELPPINFSNYLSQKLH